MSVESFPEVLTSYMIEAHEIGESGTPHLQGFCILKERMRLTQLKVLCPTAHFEACKGTPYQNFLYCAKGDQSHEEWLELREAGPNYGANALFLEWGQRPKAPINAHKKKPADNTYAEALAAPTIEEGMDIVRKRKARDYCLHGESIERNLKRAKVSKINSNSKYDSSAFIETLKPLDRSTLFCGPSGFGKTQFALAHFKNPLLVRHIDKLKNLHPDHDGIVFDDMSFKHIPHDGVIHLLDIDCDSDIHVRYGVATIPANTRRIFTHNTPNPFYKDDVEDAQKVAVERRLSRYTFHSKLFVVAPDDDFM